MKSVNFLLLSFCLLPTVGELLTGLGELLTGLGKLLTALGVLLAAHTELLMTLGDLLAHNGTGLLGPLVRVLERCTLGLLPFKLLS